MRKDMRKLFTAMLVIGVGALTSSNALAATCDELRTAERELSTLMEAVDKGIVQPLVALDRAAGGLEKLPDLNVVDRAKIKASVQKARELGGKPVHVILAISEGQERLAKELVARKCV